MLTANAYRVSSNTSHDVNESIRIQTEDRMKKVAAAGRSAIERRLVELDEEWDVERYLETLAPSFTLLGIALGLTRDRRWFLFPLVVQSFFLQHALQGWCPPMPVLRHLGVRTVQEIEHERCCLKNHLATLGDHQPILADHWRS